MTNKLNFRKASTIPFSLDKVKVLKSLTRLTVSTCTERQTFSQPPVKKLLKLLFTLSHTLYCLKELAYYEVPLPEYISIAYSVGYNVL